MCKQTHSRAWHVGANLSAEVAHIEDIEPSDWVCDDCVKTVSSPKCVKEKVMIREQILERSLSILHEHGAVLLSDLVRIYVEELESAKVVCAIEREKVLLRKYLSSRLDCAIFKAYVPSARSGEMYYDESKINGSAIAFVYKLLLDDNRMKSDMRTERIRAMIKRQISMFPKGKNFDYRTLFKNDCSNDLCKYFDPELLAFMDNITKSDRVLGRTTHDPSQRDAALYPHRRKIKLMTAVSLLANTYDPSCCFFQTLIGLTCYSQGLRDKGFRVLNALGVTTSISYIRQHGCIWARLRKAIDELNPKAFWRVTFDNLDFRIKFAKTLVAGGGDSLKRMLHLLTSQVSFRCGTVSHPLENQGENPAL